MVTPAPAVTERPQRADARRNRERLLEAGRTAFAERGQDVQMDEVAQLAGVGVGTLYRHFPTKEALVLELVRQSVQTCIDCAVQAGEREEPGEAVEWLVHETARNMSSNRGLRDALASIQFDDESPWSAEELVSATAAVLKRAQKAGAVRRDFTVDDWQAVMCGLSAAIASGAEPDRLAGFALAALRPD